MHLRNALVFVGLPIFICGGFSLPASAEDAPDVASCVAQNGGFQMHGNLNSFVFTLANKCEKRLKCTLDVYVTGAKGPDSGRGTLIIAPKSQGSAAKKSFSIKVKEAGGTAQVSHACKAL